MKAVGSIIGAENASEKTTTTARRTEPKSSRAERYSCARSATKCADAAVRRACLGKSAQDYFDGLYVVTSSRHVDVHSPHGLTRKMEAMCTRLTTRNVTLAR